MCEGMVTEKYANIIKRPANQTKESPQPTNKMLFLRNMLRGHVYVCSKPLGFHDEVLLGSSVSVRVCGALSLRTHDKRPSQHKKSPHTKSPRRPADTQNTKQTLPLSELEDSKVNGAMTSCDIWQGEMRRRITRSRIKWKNLGEKNTPLGECLGNRLHCPNSFGEKQDVWMKFMLINWEPIRQEPSYEAEPAGPRSTTHVKRFSKFQGQKLCSLAFITS